MFGTPGWRGLCSRAGVPWVGGMCLGGMGGLWRGRGVVRRGAVLGGVVWCHAHAASTGILSNLSPVCDHEALQGHLRDPPPTLWPVAAAGDGFATDKAAIATYGLSDASPFFDSLLTRTYR